MIVLDFWDAVLIAILGLFLLWFILWFIGSVIVNNVKHIFKGRKKGNT